MRELNNQELSMVSGGAEQVSCTISLALGPFCEATLSTWVALGTGALNEVVNFLGELYDDAVEAISGPAEVEPIPDQAPSSEEAP